MRAHVAAGRLQRMCAIGHQHAADLRREHILVARLVAEKIADAALAEPGAIHRRRIEVADAAVPRRLQQRPRRIFRRRAPEVADRRAAEADARELEAGRADRPRRDHRAAQSMPRVRMVRIDGLLELRRLVAERGVEHAALAVALLVDLRHDGALRATRRLAARRSSSPAPRRSGRRGGSTAPRCARSFRCRP